MTPDKLPILYSFRRCPYAMRARLAIHASEQTCRLREVVLREKPSEMLAASPKGTVPVLVLQDGTVIDESLDIMDWALGRNDPEAWLLPDSNSAEDARSLIARFDSGFKHHLDRYKYANRYEGADSETHRQEGSAYLAELDTRLEHAPYLFGARPSLSDMAIFPFVRQFANTDRTWFDAQDWPRLQAWLDRLLTSDRFIAIMKKYPQWKTGDQEPLFGQQTS